MAEAVLLRALNAQLAEKDRISRELMAKQAERTRLMNLYNEARTDRCAQVRLFGEPIFRDIFESGQSSEVQFELVAVRLGLSRATSETTALLGSIERAVRATDNDPYIFLPGDEVR